MTISIAYKVLFPKLRRLFLLPTKFCSRADSINHVPQCSWSHIYLNECTPLPCLISCDLEITINFTCMRTALRRKPVLSQANHCFSPVPWFTEKQKYWSSSHDSRFFVFSIAKIESITVVIVLVGGTGRGKVYGEILFFRVLLLVVLLILVEPLNWSIFLLSKEKKTILMWLVSLRTSSCCWWQ